MDLLDARTKEDNSVRQLRVLDSEYSPSSAPPRPPVRCQADQTSPPCRGRSFNHDKRDVARPATRGLPHRRDVTSPQIKASPFQPTDSTKPGDDQHVRPTGGGSDGVERLAVGGANKRHVTANCLANGHDQVPGTHRPIKQAVSRTPLTCCDAFSAPSR